MCPEPPAVAFATRDGSATLYLSTHKYTCDDNKRFEDGYSEKIIICQDNQEWTESYFTCAGNSIF